MSITEDFRNAFRKPNNGLMQIIIINVVVFVVVLLLDLLLPQALYVNIYRQLVLPAKISEFLYKPWTLVTYSFTHDMSDFLHILFNMLTFYWFGKLIEEYLGNRRLINIYMLGGLAGGVLFLICYNTIPYFVANQSPGVIGSSGAVYAVVIGAATLMPNYTFFLFLIGPVRIKYIAAVIILLSLIQSRQNPGGNFAHLGGALLGYIYVTQLKKGIDIAQPLRNLWSNFQKLFLRKRKMQVTYRKAVASSAEYPSEDEVDRILDKINRSGYESLTKEEKQKLFQFSQKS
jgi:membrane associated rhomboid family serine protease